MSHLLKIVMASESRLRQWVQLYRVEGLRALSSNWQGNNAKKLTDAERTDLKTRLHSATLRQYQLSEPVFWTTNDVQQPSNVGMGWCITAPAVGTKARHMSLSSSTPCWI
jgi:hypothetical protein